jgi:glycyl-tRNA synthetase beta chain
MVMGIGRAELLIEIGVEELPAIPLLKIEKEIEESWRRILIENRLKSNFKFLYTPRRLVIMQTIALKQPSMVKESFGPPLSIALKDGKPTKAGEGFAKRCGVDFNSLSVKKKGNRKILYFKKEVKGKSIEEILPSMIESWIDSMRFGKMMRWGDRDEEFIRPLRWLQVRVDDNIVDMELFGVKSSNYTYLHRSVTFNKVYVDSISRYKNILMDGGVTLNQNIRRETILKEFESIEREFDISIERDESLLSEIVAITEHPKSLIGKFDETFLKLPPEVIITSMKEHQRYFPIFKDGKLINMFVVVSNAITDDYSKILDGNERVLKPRLSDATFFYQNDLKKGLKIDGLEKIQFIDGLGSLRDKIERERVIASRLLRFYISDMAKTLSKESSEVASLMDRAVTLAKADLLTEMVYEFTELQGLMGYYYAKALGEDELVYTAIKEQYLPQGEGDRVPSNLFSAVLALSIKLDTLLGLFSIGKIPTGSKDPFSLRRAVNGTIRIVKEFEISFEIGKILELLSDLYREFDKSILEEFIIERIYRSLDINPSIIKAVILSDERDLLKIIQKSQALDSIANRENFREIFSTFKRVANISKDVDLSESLLVDEALFESEYEHRLKMAFDEVVSREYGNYRERLETLFSLKNILDSFFDNVLVNSEDKRVRKNRQNLIASIYKSFRDIADIKEISVSTTLS